jgi:hypothetical protein
LKAAVLSPGQRLESQVLASSYVEGKTKNGRGALYIVWGDRVDGLLRRSLAALNQVHPELPVEVVRLSNNNDGFHAKSRMFSLSPFSETVFLDADTVVLRRLDFAFEKAARFGLACCMAPMTWAAVTGYSSVESGTIMYNTGVVFFSERSKAVFDLWEKLSSGPQPSDYWDQGPFALAVERLETSPFILPPNWNFMPAIHRQIVGSVTIWHAKSNPPPGIGSLDETSLFDVEKTFPFTTRRRQLRLGWRLIRQGLGLRRS